MKRFWEIICALGRVWRLGLMLGLFLLFLSVFTLVAVNPGTNSYYISFFNVALLLGIVVVNVSLLHICNVKSEV